jgi:prepilin-type N-terminal cleavage/methylation domain-containing protein
MKYKHRAFSLMELALVVAILGMMAYIAVPRVQAALKTFYQAGTFSQQFITDLRLSRSMAIANASTNNVGFVMQMTGSQPYTGYVIKNLSTGAVVSTYAIDPAIQCTGGTSFQFGPLGNLLVGSDSHFVISAAGKNVTIDIVAATGSVTYVEN